MPFSGPFDLSLGGYTVTPGQGSPGSPAPVDLGAYTVFPGGGRVGAPGLGFGPSTAAYNPGSGFFEGAVSGSPESITGAISGPGTPNLTGSAGPSVAGSPNAPSDGPAGPQFSSGFLGQNIGILGGNLPSTFASQGVIGNALNQGLSNVGITNPTAQTMAGLALTSAANAAVPGLGPVIAGINAVSKGLTNSQMAQTLNEGLINPNVNIELPDPQAGQNALNAEVAAQMGMSGPAGGLSGMFTGPPALAHALGRLQTIRMTGEEASAPDGSPSGNVSGVGPGAPTGGGPADNPHGEEANDSSSAAAATAAAAAAAASTDPADVSQSDEGTGSGGGPSGDKIICAELYRQGFMDEPTYRADEAFGEYLRKYDPVALAGYHRWARPVVAVMRRSRWATRGVWLVAKPWAQAMAGQTNRVGSVLMAVGLPLCRLVGQIEARAVRGVA